ncbi:hypothetical protein RvY_19463 [Ramazzottius varieornatus]|uniref:Uncharacterized protein n=1 Tax=Ramazzottius varieornatus TaxID=947166 RepID=A0A1D1WC98_RAMVA|nr:hypothetical protein RvY_19463 [Ramazzottius varieornatus]
MMKVICPENLWTVLGGKYPYEKIPLYDIGEEDSDQENDDFEDGLIVIQESLVENMEDLELRKFYDLAAMHSHARPIVRLRS